MGLSLRINVIWSIAGNIVYALGQWAILVIIARFGGADKLGIFALGLSICAPIVMFTNMRMRYIQASDARNEKKFVDYLSARLTLSAVAMIVIVIIIFLGSFSQNIAATIFFIGLAKIVEALSDIYYGFFQKRERLDYIAKSMLIKSSLTVLLFGLVFITTNDIVLACVSLVISWTTTLYTVDLISRVRVDMSVSHDYRTAFKEGIQEQILAIKSASVRSLSPLVSKAIPLGSVAFLASLTVNVPRYFIEHNNGEAALGYFSAVGYIMIAGVSVIVALAETSLARLSVYYSSEDRYRFTSLLGKMIGLSLGMGVIGIIVAAVFGDVILSLIYGEQYGVYQDLFVLLMIAATFNYLSVILWFTITSVHEFRIQLPVFFIDTVLVVVMSMILIPEFGLRGAAYTMIGVMIYQVMAGAVVIWKIINDQDKRIASRGL
ncbi:MAG TPA: hypothetical protein EYH06_14225 [Chromatiales bacterium]|nr:hypothetical protein [Chromatiales bacterium]